MLADAEFPQCAQHRAVRVCIHPSRRVNVHEVRAGASVRTRASHAFALLL